MTHSTNSSSEPLNMQYTEDVFNGVLEAAIKSYRADRCPENLNIIMNQLHMARVLVIGGPEPQTEGKAQSVHIGCITNNNGARFIPVYTSKKYIPPNAPASIMNMEYYQVNRLAAEADGELAGIVFDPFTPELNLTFNKRLVVAWAREEGERRRKEKEAGQQ